MFSQKLVFKVTVLIAGFFFSLLLSPSIYALTVDRIVAKVNSEIITLMKLEGRVAVFLNQMKAAGSVVTGLEKSKIMKDVLDGMIVEKLQIQEAKKLGMVVTEEEIQKSLDGIYTKNNIRLSSLRISLTVKVVISMIIKKLFMTKFSFLG